jgi:integrase
MVEASQAFKTLDEHSEKTGDAVTLREVVAEYLERWEQQHESVTLAALFTEYLALKSHRTPDYLKQFKYCQDKLGSLTSKLLTEITPLEISQAIADVPAGNRNAYMRYLRAIFNLGLKRGYLKENPILRLDFTHRPRQEVYVLPHRLVRAMLMYAYEHEPKLVSFLTLGFFCGIRTDGDLPKMAWSDIDFENNRVVIRTLSFSLPGAPRRKPSDFAKSVNQQVHRIGPTSVGLISEIEARRGLDKRLISGYRGTVKINRYMDTKLSKLQKAILREGLAYVYAKPVREAFQKGLAEHWAKRGGNRFLDEQRPEGFDVRYSMCEVWPELGKHITVSFFAPYRGGGKGSWKGPAASQRREALLSPRAATSRALRRLVERFLIEKVSHRLWKLTPAGEEVATSLFPDLKQWTAKEIEEAYQAGLENK